MKPEKPIGRKAYGSIPHLPGSRRGPGDRGIEAAQARILLEQVRDKHDLVTVHEKLDGTNVAVAKVNGAIIPLMRAGYAAALSMWPQHHHFHDWAMKRADRFRRLLNEGERVVGEWLLQAHGTRYTFAHEPFVAFDLIRGEERGRWSNCEARLLPAGFMVPHKLHAGGPCSIEQALELLGEYGHHGANDKVEGAVWRIERKGHFDFMAKYVRPEKVDGCYLPEKNGTMEPIWNVQPESL